MPHFAIVIADDFSGGNDCAGSFAASGHAAYTSPLLSLPESSPAVLVLSAETRFLEPPAAERRSRSFWQATNHRARRFSYQKMDSTLRGNPGEEILGFLGATGARRIAFCPAYPRHGRQVRRGELWVHGRPLLETEFAKDPLSPSRSNRPLSLFPKGLAEALPLASEAHLRRSIRDSKARILCFDASNENDLRRLLRACLKEGIRHFAGSSGLSELLADLHGVEAASSAPRLPRKRGILVGSVSERSLEQVEVLRHSGAAPCWSLDEKLPAAPKPRFALTSLRRREEMKWHRKPLDQWRFAEARMGKLVRQGLKMGQGPYGRLWLLTGGHCAVRFFSALELKGAWVRQNLEPGLPLLEAQASGAKIWMSSKPGGFGDRDLMHRFMGF